jgi:hypothetical protein
VWTFFVDSLPARQIGKAFFGYVGNQLFLDGRDKQAAKDKGSDEHAGEVLGGGHN